MYSLFVRQHFMIAHSFQGEVFGPAQKLHGATYVVDVEFFRPELDGDNLVVDIGLAGDVLKQLLDEMNYQNLDEVAAFAGQNTTTEFLAKAIFDRMADAIVAGKLGETAMGLTAMKVILKESHLAGASYQAPLQSPSS